MAFRDNWQKTNLDSALLICYHLGAGQERQGAVV
jgi:hypothetical protein